MALNIARLTNVKEHADGTIQARCPACAESGQDKAGRHLFVRPDGRFGCVAHQEDREHRKRIWALVGVPSVPQEFRVRPVKVAKAAAVTIKLDENSSANSTREAPFVGKLDEKHGTLGTAVGESVSLSEKLTEASCCSESELGGVGTLGTVCKSGTLGTALSAPRAYRKNDHDLLYRELGTDKSVPSVPSLKALKQPYLTGAGDLVIPFDSDPRFHWWKGGQSVALTRAEVKGEF